MNQRQAMTLGTNTLQTGRIELSVQPMLGTVLCGVMLASLLGVGCNRRKAEAVRVEAVNFAYPDEKVEREGFVVLADRRIFATMAFLNAVGYDEERKGFQMHPARVKVRRAVARNLTNQQAQAKLRTWRQYHRERLFPPFMYQSFALSLSADYPFRRIRPDEELGYPHSAAALSDFPGVLNDFWETARLGEIWAELKPDYRTAIQRYDPDKMARQMDFVWDYLRMERRDTLVIVHVPNLLSRHLGAMGAEYGSHFYSVDNPGANDGRLNVHEYLHTIVNPLVKDVHGGYGTKLDAYYQAGKTAPAVKSYRDPVTFVFECLVLALDRRISMRFENDPAWSRLKESQVANNTEAGLNLTQPFYDLLEDYEESSKSFEEFLPIMLERLPTYGR